MKHLGDIAAIDWAEVEPVDCVTGGSPCQDLSVAGRRAGLAGKRSGLFMEQIRCVKELRRADERCGRTGAMVRPRFMVWENVPGAFSSNGGKDFAAVLEETIKIVELQAPAVPVPEKGWPRAGCIYDDMGRWSVAWRVHDAQFWGVPQRRKRIALVADFGGLSAPEVLFERKGLSRDIEPGETAREEAAGAVGDGIDCAGGEDIKGCLPFDMTQVTSPQNGCNPHYGDPCHPLAAGARPPTICLNDQGGSMMSVTEDVTGILRAQEHGHQPIVAGFKAGQSMGGNGDGQTVCTLTGDHQNRVTDYTALCVGNGQLNQMSMGEQANTLDTMHDQQCVMVCGLDSNKNGYVEQAGALQAHTSGGSTEFVNDQRNVVRRLTPLECERLQGFPDFWTDIGDWTDSKGKKHKAADSPRYKALGNSIALPFWKWLLKRISAQYERDATLGSLFDGMGGFPYLWEQINGKGSALWASEIEEFCIAVTKERIG